MLKRAAEVKEGHLADRTGQADGRKQRERFAGRHAGETRIMCGLVAQPLAHRA
jgi:hypothetical protein